MQETQSPLVYTPQAPKQQPAPPPQYELIKDVTGKAPEPRGQFIMKDRNGTQVKMPHPPKQNCKKCHGRGYIGINAKDGRFIFCHKCYTI
jgi:hypothetical protein